MNNVKINVQKTLKKVTNKINTLVPNKDIRMLYVLTLIITIIIIAVFIYMNFTYIWTDKIAIVLQDDPIDGRIGNTFINALTLSDTKRTYSCTFCFWLNLRSMSNMQQTDVNYILSYEMDDTEGITNPYFNIIYGAVDDTSLNQFTIIFKNMEDTSEHLVVKDVYLQKWLCIQIVMRDLVIDFYFNGELAHSKELNYIPILSDQGNLYIGKDNGFNGTMTKLVYFNYALGETDLDKYYRQGYEGDISGWVRKDESWLSKGRVMLYIIIIVLIIVFIMLRYYLMKNSQE